VPTHRFRFDGCLREHDHFLCTRCERIEDIESVARASAAFPDRLRHVGKVYSVQRVYLGACRSCLEKTPGKATASAIRADEQADRPRGGEW